MAGFPVGILKPPVSCELGLDRESEAFRKPARIGYAAGVVLWGLSGRSRAVPKRLASRTPRNRSSRPKEAGRGQLLEALAYDDGTTLSPP